MPDKNPIPIFEVFNEIGIIDQLGRAILEARLPDGVIAPHFVVLNHLTRVRDGQTPIVLAKAFQVPKTTMTHTLKGLEARGLVDLRTNPDDGRSKQVWLTDAGKALLATTIQALALDFEELALDFDVAQLTAIKPVLTAFRIYLDARRNS
jgi:DNA-binding MarR family transcriptional regulator